MRIPFQIFAAKPTAHLASTKELLAFLSSRYSTILLIISNCTSRRIWRSPCSFWRSSMCTSCSFRTSESNITATTSSAKRRLFIVFNLIKIKDPLEKTHKISRGSYTYTHYIYNTNKYLLLNTI